MGTRLEVSPGVLAAAQARAGGGLRVHSGAEGTGAARLVGVQDGSGGVERADVLRGPTVCWEFAEGSPGDHCGSDALCLMEKG